jgi:type II secretory pathway component PulF
MSDVSLQQVSAFNRELIALAETGFPLDIGIDEPTEQVSARLEKVNSLLAMRVGRGQSIQQAVEEEPELPRRYRMALRTWLRCDDPTIALNEIATPADARLQFRRNVGQTMLYPLILMSLAYFAFLYLCNVTAPKIEAIYIQLSQTPSSSLSAITAARNLMPIWGPLLPLLLVLALICWRLLSSRWSWTWVPGSSRYFSARRNAHLAQQLATLLESGSSLEESLSLVGPLANASSDAGIAAEGNRSTESLPPLLRWALSGDSGGEPMPRVLRFVAQTYRQNAERQQTIWRVVAPTIAGLLLGGMFVLGYGLSLFVPVIQLLKDISLPGGV